MTDPAHPPAPPYIDLTRPHVRCYVTGPVPLPAACRAAVDALAAAVDAAADALAAASRPVDRDA